MSERNENREVFLNEHALYHKMRKSRGLNGLRHYGKLKLNQIVSENIREMTLVDHIWKTGDRLSKLAFKYYGSTEHWWVIGWFNKKPIDNLYKIGDMVHIPLPLEDVLYYIQREDG